MRPDGPYFKIARDFMGQRTYWYVYSSMSIKQLFFYLIHLKAIVDSYCIYSAVCGRTLIVSRSNLYIAVRSVQNHRIHYRHLWLCCLLQTLYSPFSLRAHRMNCLLRQVDTPYSLTIRW